MNFLEWAITKLSYIFSPGKRELIKYAKIFNNSNGLEIGGPSAIFKLKGAFPIYLYANNIDGVNFSTNTIWEGDILQGNNYAYYGKKNGKQFIAEAVDLSFLHDKQYDFILSCHSLEHTANPLKVLKEWNRVLKIGGAFVLILPNKEFTFDKNRPITKMQHLITDLNNNTSENDETHFNEVNTLHDLSFDVLDSREALQSRTSNNATLRALHHHVFDFSLIQEMLLFTGFKIEIQRTYPPFHLINVAVKISDIA
jgi:SAM-dependent methyltransferase